MKYRKYIFILLFSIIIYLLLTFLYNNIIVKNDFVTAYIAKEDISSGELLNIEKLNLVKLQGNIDSNVLISLEDIQNKVLNKDIESGTFITKDKLINKDEYVDDGKRYEYISLKLESTEQNVSYKIKKNSKINIYYTAKTAQIKDLVSQSQDIITFGISDTYTTISFLNNVKVIDSINKNGVSTEELGTDGVDNLLDTIIIRVTKDIAMKINNLKNYGTFSCTLIE